jgi:tetratricopeptide (TPR) repeat protein
MAIFGKALEIDSNNAGLWYNRACARVKQGDTGNGLADLKKAIEIDEKYVELAKQEKDFESIRNNERFKALVE